MYPHTAGYAKNSETSKDAAELCTTREALHRQIMDSLDRTDVVTIAGRTYTVGLEQGLTGDEAQVLCERYLGGKFHRGTISARMTELKILKRIVTTTARRPSIQGRSSSVCVLKRYQSMNEKKPIEKKEDDSSLILIAKELKRIIDTYKDPQGYVSVTLHPFDVKMLETLIKRSDI